MFRFTNGVPTPVDRDDRQMEIMERLDAKLYEIELKLAAVRAAERGSTLAKVLLADFDDLVSDAQELNRAINSEELLSGQLPGDTPETAATQYGNRKLTRQERLQGLADSGIDTIEEYRDYMGDDDDIGD